MFCSGGVWKELENWYFRICCRFMINLVFGFVIFIIGFLDIF